MEQAIQIRPYHPQDRPYLEAIIRKTWNYAFYEHLGMMRQAEKQQTIQVGKEQGEMTFFVYDYTC